MNASICFALVMIAASLPGCETESVTSPDSQHIDIRMDATQRNAGRIAQATLVPLGNETSMTVFVSGVPADVTRPVHLYTYIYPGTCANPGAVPAFELNRTVNTYHLFRGDGLRLTKTAPVALTLLRSSDYSIILRTSPADGSFDIFCGNIR